MIHLVVVYNMISAGSSQECVRPVPMPRKSLSRRNCQKDSILERKLQTNDLLSNPEDLIPAEFSESPQSSLILDCLNESASKERPRYSLERLVPVHLRGATDENGKQKDEHNTHDKLAKMSSIHLSLNIRKRSAKGNCECFLYLTPQQCVKKLVTLPAEKECFMEQPYNQYDDLQLSPLNDHRNLTVFAGADEEHHINLSDVVSSTHRTHFTLLERIVKTTHIWFLPHLSRSAVAHLLGAQSFGTFIIRSSSKIGGNERSRSAAMAMSIRMQATSTAECIDHYIIEAVCKSCVRIRGSPNVFSSVPELIEHYCLNGDELRINLTLPADVMACSSILELQALDLMGQDFWTSRTLTVDADKDQFCLSVHSQSSHNEFDSNFSCPTIQQNIYMDGSSEHSFLNPYYSDYSEFCAPLYSKNRQIPLRKSVSTCENFNQPNYCLISTNDESNAKPTNVQSLHRQKPKKSCGIGFLRNIFSTSSVKGSAKSSTLPLKNSHSYSLGQSSNQCHQPIQHHQYQRSADGEKIEQTLRDPSKGLRRRESFDAFSFRNFHRSSISEECSVDAKSIEFNKSTNKTVSKKLTQAEIEARQTALRRMNTDLSHASIARRLAQPCVPSKPPTLPKPKMKAVQPGPSWASFNNCNSNKAVDASEYDLTSGGYTNQAFHSHSLRNYEKPQQSNIIPPLCPLRMNNDEYYNFSKVPDLGADSDTLSIATEFNEPWDSHLWHNLLNIASIGDQNQNSTPRNSTLRTPPCKSQLSNSSSRTAITRIELQDMDCHLDVVGTSTPIPNNQRMDEELQNTEEAVAMAVVLAGTGTLHKAKPKNDWITEIEIQTPKRPSMEGTVKGLNRQIGVFNDPTLESLVLVENAARSAQNGRLMSTNTSLATSIPQSSSSESLGRNYFNSHSFNNDGLNMLKNNCSNSSRSPNLRSVMKIKVLPTIEDISDIDEDKDSEISTEDLSARIYTLALPAVSPPRFRLSSESPVQVIKDYIDIISKNEATIFGATLKRFVECTQNSREKDPYIVIRRIRQFLTGLKNYLIKNGEAELHAIIQKQSERLFANEFLNIDAIIEDVLCRILLKRIKPQLYRLMIIEITKTGELARISENLSSVRNMSSTDLGFFDDITFPDPNTLEKIDSYLKKMQRHYSPLKKLEILLKIISLVLSSNLSESKCFSPNSTLSNSKAPSIASIDKLNTSSRFVSQPPAEELIRWLVYIFAKNLYINCEVEAWYIWELLPQQVLTTGNSAYYLSTLFSAIHVIKNPESLKRLKNYLHEDEMGSRQTLHDDVEVSDAFLRVAIPNETGGTIEYHTFPVLPRINSAKLCRIIATKFAISNPGDFDLYVLFDGFETLLKPDDLPYLIRDRLCEAGKHHLFAYKRNDIRIAWPKQASC